MAIEYTVGAVNGEGFYIQIPWHLRGTAAELMAGYERKHAEGIMISHEGCLGFEFRDNGVQIQRHKFPWAINA